MVIAKEESIRAAAERLGLSPATLSSRLASFEQSLDTQLFIRERSHLRLTPEGVRLYQNGQEILSDYQRMVKQMELVSGDTLHSLRIGIIGSEFPFHIGPYLDLVNLRNPDIHIDLLDDNAFSLEEDLLSGEIDLCIGPMMTSFRHEEIVCQTIAPPHSSVILPLTHPLSQSESISIQQLEGETFLLYPENRCDVIRRFQLSNLDASLKHYSIAETRTSGFYLNNLVPVGKGIMISPFHAPVDMPRCILRPLTDLSFPAPDSILHLKNPRQKELKTFIADFLSFVRDSSHSGWTQTISLGSSREPAK